jgi:hypothetical protein
MLLTAFQHALFRDAAHYGSKGCALTPNSTRRYATDMVVIDDFEWDIVAFVLRWAPYGGPSEEESLPHFGMTCAQLQTRFAGVIRKLGDFPRASLSDPQRDLVQQGRRLLASQTFGAKRTSVPRQSDVRFTTDLAEATGRWSLRHGVWHWTTD